MKIILSRKGVDSFSGGISSIISEAGRMRSIPIPARWDKSIPVAPRDTLRYKDLPYEGKSLGLTIEKLISSRKARKERMRQGDPCHLDPDLSKANLRTRARGWLPMFGQVDKAASHLLNEGVREGDLFLFFGWFRRSQDRAGRLRFDPNDRGTHVIFGWLQIGEIWCQSRPKPAIPGWARYHPHVRGSVANLYNSASPINVVFIAKQRLEIPGIRSRLLGGGVFSTFHEDLCLTEPNRSRSHWRLPSWMYPFPNRKPLTYHEKGWRWRKRGRRALLKTVGRGQEFILDLDSSGDKYSEKYPVEKVQKWLGKIFAHAR